MKFNVGIIGCGRIAGIYDKPHKTGFVGTHAQAYYRNKLFNIQTAVDSKNLETFQKIWSVPNGYFNINELLENEKLDVISVCSPNEFHYEHIKKILISDSCPKVIFAEKPICLKPSELKELKNLVNKTKCKIIVNHTRRYDPGHKRVRQFIKSQELGKLICGRCDYYGGWLHNGCHLIDTLRMLFDTDPMIESVDQGAPGKPNDPCINVKLKILNAPVDIISFDQNYYQIYDNEFRFEKGRIFLQDFGKKIVVEKSKSDERNDKVLVPLPDSPWKGIDSPLLHAVDLIGKYLADKVPLSGHGVLLDEVTSTMNILWKAREIYDNSTKKEVKTNAKKISK